METVAKGLFRKIWQPQLQFVRCKTKVNVTTPRPPHFERALMETVCKPVFAKQRKLQHVPDYESCLRVERKAPEKEHPLKTLLAKESLNWFKNSRMVAFFHMNSLDSEEKFQCQLLLKKNGLKFLIFNRAILQKAFSGTIYETVLKLYDAPTATAFSPEPDIHKLLKIAKKLPKLALMGGIIDNRLLSLTELQTYGKFENISQAQLMLLNTLNSSSQNIVRQLNHHPSNFVELLNQHKKIIEGQ